jgi:hypothetical protein
VLQFLRRRWLVASFILLLAGGAIAFLYLRRGEPLLSEVEDEPEVSAIEEAPRDLQKLREPYTAGLEALARNDGEDAVRHFSSFHFGSRPVEEYRLYYLANGHQLAGDAAAARVTLARLWRREPKMIYGTTPPSTLRRSMRARAISRKRGGVRSDWESSGRSGGRGQRAGALRLHVCTRAISPARCSTHARSSFTVPLGRSERRERAPAHAHRTSRTPRGCRSRRTRDSIARSR